MPDTTRDTGGDAIQLDGVTKSFGGPFAFLQSRRRRIAGTIPVLQDVTLRVREGEIMGLVGANGAGKTTLLEILATVQLPTSGRALVGGHDVRHQSMHVRRVIGYCPAGGGGFYPTLTARQNLEFFGALVDLSPRDAALRAEAVLEIVGLAGVGGVVFQRFSAGMRQKLMLARALLGNPSILLLDEPTRSLDRRSKHDFHELLRHTLVAILRKTALLVTHDVHEVGAVCDRVALLRDGRITQVGLPGCASFENDEESRAGRFAGTRQPRTTSGCESVA
jgi:ABC-2 type transport system ATP-binding protein